MFALNNIDLNTIDLKTPTSSFGNYYFTKLSINADDKLSFNLPVGKLKKEIATVRRGDMNMNFNFESHSSDEANTCCLMLQNIEDKIVDVLYKKSSEWFENEITHDDIKDCLFGFLKFEKGGKEASIKIKLNCDKNDVNNIYLCDKKIVTVDELNELNQFIPTVCVSGVKFNSKSFYIILELDDYQIQNVSEQESEPEPQDVSKENETKMINFDENEDESENNLLIVEDEEKTSDENVLDANQNNEHYEAQTEEHGEELNEHPDGNMNLNNEDESMQDNQNNEDENLDNNGNNEEINIDDIEEVKLTTENLEEKINFDESKNVLKLNENRILFYKLYMLFNEQIKTHQVDTILGKLGDMNISYDRFIDFINNEEEEFYDQEKFILN